MMIDYDNLFSYLYWLHGMLLDILAIYLYTNSEL